MAGGLSSRRILIVNPRLQFRYLVLPLVVAATTASCLFLLFVVQAQSLKTLAATQKDEFLVQELSSAQFLAVVTHGAVLLAHMGLILWLGIVASHRIAGPLYRLKRTMEQVTAGDRKVRFSVREKDQLGDVAELFNEMMDAVASREEELRAAVAKAADESRR